MIIGLWILHKDPGGASLWYNLRSPWYVTQFRKTPVYDLGIATFREVVAAKVKDRLLRAMLSMVRKERAGRGSFWTTEGSCCRKPSFISTSRRGGGLFWCHSSMRSFSFYTW